MSWSYSGNPASSALDAVRFLLLDTDIQSQLLSNEEINYLLSVENDNIYEAAIRGAIQASAKFGRKGSKSVGDLSIEYGAQADFYQSLADRLRRERVLRGGSGAALFTANSKDDKRQRENDTDRVDPLFTRKQGEYRPLDELTNDYSGE